LRRGACLPLSGVRGVRGGTWFPRAILRHLRQARQAQPLDLKGKLAHGEGDLETIKV